MNMTKNQLITYILNNLSEFEDLNNLSEKTLKSIFDDISCSCWSGEG